MTDQTIPDVTDNDRRLARKWAEGIVTGLSSPRALAAARVILHAVPAPPRPTLADMTEEERRECQWMQCEVRGDRRIITLILDDSDHNYVVTLSSSGYFSTCSLESVTPRPDLPRLEWPGDKKAALEETPESEEEFMENIEKALDDHYGPLPTPALPEGWRLADHLDHGRGIVTNTTPNHIGAVCLLLPDAEKARGCAWFFCDPAELTYIGQGADQ